jgi:hypothetical protein
VSASFERDIFNKDDAALIASPNFVEVAGLFADADKYHNLVHYGYGNSLTPVERASGEIDTRTPTIHLLGYYVLTNETIGKLKRRGFGKIAVHAEALEILRTVDIDIVQGMREKIHNLAANSDYVYERPMFEKSST